MCTAANRWICLSAIYLLVFCAMAEYVCAAQPEPARGDAPAGQLPTTHDAVALEADPPAAGIPFQIEAGSVAVIDGGSADEQFSIGWNVAGDESAIGSFRVFLLELRPDQAMPFGKIVLQATVPAERRNFTGHLDVAPASNAYYLVPVVVALPSEQARVRTPHQRIGPAWAVAPAQAEGREIPQPELLPKFTFEEDCDCAQPQQFTAEISPSGAPAGMQPGAWLIGRAESHTAIFLDQVPPTVNLAVRAGTNPSQTEVTFRVPFLPAGSYRLCGYLGFLGQSGRANSAEVEMICRLTPADLLARTPKPARPASRTFDYVQHISLATSGGRPTPMKLVEQAIQTGQIKGNPPHQLDITFAFLNRGRGPIDLAHPPALFGLRLLPVPASMGQPDLTVDWHAYELPFAGIQSRGIAPYPPLTDRGTVIQSVIKNVGLGATDKSFETRLLVDGATVAKFPFPSEAEKLDQPTQKISFKPGETRVYAHTLKYSEQGSHVVRWGVDAASDVEKDLLTRKNNVAQRTLTWQQPPDLKVVDIWPKYPTPLGGQKGVWKIKVTNQGKGKVNLPFQTTFWPLVIEQGKVQAVTGGSQESFWHMPPLDPGASVVFESTQFFMQWGEKKLRGVVDVQNYVPEALPIPDKNIEDGEKNNELIKKFNLQAVDLRVPDKIEMKPAKPILGDLVTLRFKIKNAGAADALQPFQVKLYPGAVVQDVIGPHLFSVKSLAAGKEVELVSNPLALPGGDHNVTIEVDVAASYFEEKQNNVGLYPIHVTDFAEPLGGAKRTIGKSPLLVILWDPQRPGHPAPSKTDIEKSYFGSGASIKRFFLEMSGGRFTLEKAAIVGWYKSKFPASHYWTKRDQEDLPEDRNGNQNIDPGEDLNGNGLLDGPDGILQKDEDKNNNGKLDYDLNKDGWIFPHFEKYAEAIRMAEKDFDFAKYDTNKDGKVDPAELGICMVIPQKTASGYQRGVVGKEQPKEDLIVDKVKIDSIAECYTPTTPNVRLAAHELSHLFLGAGDMYFSGKIADKMKLHNVTEHPFRASAYSLMAVESFHLDPVHKLKLGWLQPIIAQKSGYYTLRSVETHHEVLVLADTAKLGQEFFVLENRWPANTFDKGLPDQGLALWHVIQDSQIYQNIKEPYLESGDYARRAIRLRRVDGGKPKINNAQALWDGSDAKTGYDLTDKSQPTNLRWQDDSPSGFQIKQIPSAGGTMKFYVQAPPQQQQSTWTEIPKKQETPSGPPGGGSGWGKSKP